MGGPTLYVVNRSVVMGGCYGWLLWVVALGGPTLYVVNRSVLPIGCGPERVPGKQRIKAQVNNRMANRIATDCNHQSACDVYAHREGHVALCGGGGGEWWCRDGVVVVGDGWWWLRVVVTGGGG